MIDPRSFSIPLAVSGPSLEYFSWLTALGVFAALALPVVLLGVRSMAGLGPLRQWVSIGVRLLVLAVVVLILGGIRWEREHKDLEVIFLRDVSASTANVKTTINQPLQASIDTYMREVSGREDKPAGDRVGSIVFQNSASIDAIPNTTLQLGSGAIREAGTGTDISSAIQLGLATMAKDAMHRLVLISDGNQTAGDVIAAAEQAKAQGVKIDVMPLTYSVDNEVIIERFVAPTWKRETEPFTIDVILRSTNSAPVTGQMSVYHQNELMDLDPYTPGKQTNRQVTLEQGLNPQRVQVPPLGAGGVHQFRAEFSADNTATKIIDTLAQNNAAEAFTFVRGKGEILYVDNTGGPAGQVLADALTAEGIEIRQNNHITVDQFPSSIVQLQNYDAVILSNVARGAGGLSEEQQRLLASYVHDMGGGLVMVGGEQAFGAGGWQGSRLEEILPVDMDIPAQRQVGKGALVLVMHSCEMPNGNYWGEQCAIKAVETLSAQDEIGVVSYGWGGGPMGGGSQWDFPLGTKGDGSQVIAAIKQMKLGDMPSFDDSMDVALNGQGTIRGLKDSDARQKHVIIISDGDPQMPNQALINAYLQHKVTVSTVSVYPHTDNASTLPPNMKSIADQLRGKAYGPINTNPNQLPQIFIKEATIVRRTLIHEDRKGIRLLNQPTTTDLLKGIESIPDIYGLVLTSRKASPQVETPLVAGKNQDPVLAYWQTGLGRAAVWTSDAHNRWAAGFVPQPNFSKFWSQLVRTVARPPMSSDFEVQTTQVGDRGKIVVEAQSRDNAFLNFVNIRGTVLGPDGKTREVRLVQTAPGTYEAEFDANAQGVYAVGMSYSGNNIGGTLRSGLVVNDSPELRDLRSNDTLLRQVAEITGGEILEPFNPQVANVFGREGIPKSSSPLPVWDMLIPVLLGLVITDVAVRRIAWDWAAMKKYAGWTANQIRGFTMTTRKVESTRTLDALKGAREAVAVERTKTDDGQGAVPRPDPSRKFEAGKGVEGDISKVVGGATDKPVPAAPKNPEPKGMTGGSDQMSSLLAAKQRARQQIQQKEKGQE